MAKIIPFPVRLIPPRLVIPAEKSDFQLVIDKLIIATKRHGRSQGFMIGILVANIQHLIVQYFIK